MKIVVIGGTGLIGSKVVGLLRRGGHEVVAGSPSTGVDTVTGLGLTEALEGAALVIDVANAPNFSDGPVLDFFLTSGRNLLRAEARAGVKRHITLSVVGADRLTESGYLRAKLAQESLVRAFATDYVILRVTQFFEFLHTIADQATEGDTVRMSPAFIQPMAANDVAEQIAELTFQPNVHGVFEIGGPQAFRLCDVIRDVLAREGDPRHVIADAKASYYGAVLDERSLLPAPGANLASTRLEDWLSTSSAGGQQQSHQPPSRV